MVSGLEFRVGPMFVVATVTCSAGRLARTKVKTAAGAMLISSMCQLQHYSTSAGWNSIARHRSLSEPFSWRDKVSFDSSTLFLG